MRRSIQTSHVSSVGGREPSAADLMMTPEASHSKTACGSRGEGAARDGAGFDSARRRSQSRAGI
jgi:hypothetical protein